MVENKSFLDGKEEKDQIEVEAVIVALKYENAAKTYRIYEAQKGRGGEKFTLGCFLEQGLSVGGKYKIKGSVSLYKGKKQVTVKFADKLEIDDTDEIAIYLDNLDPSFTGFSDDLVKKYKKNTLYILKNSTEKVIRDFPYVEKKVIHTWRKKLLETESYDDAFKLLTSLKLSPKNANALIREFGTEIGLKVKKNPYFLLERGGNMTFTECDKIAMEEGISLIDLNRIKSGVLQVLKISGEQGDAFLEKSDLIKESKNRLSVQLSYKEATALLKEKVEVYKIGKNEVSFKYNDLYTFIENTKKASSEEKKKAIFTLYPIPEEEITKGIEALTKESEIVIEENRVYLYSIYEMEEALAKKLGEIEASEEKKFYPIKELLKSYESSRGITLEEKQREAVERICSTEGGVYILNGGPGCGKTFTVKIILDIIKGIYKANHVPYYENILAPTGRAAEVLSKATDREAMTIHRRLEIGEDGVPKFNSRDPILSNVLVIDESSMLDLSLAKKLFDAIYPTTKVILIGDVNQLPPIGTGKVLKDILDSNLKDKVITLNVVKRQASLSSIITNANLINNGQMIATDKVKYDTIVLKNKENKEILKTILSFTSAALKKGKEKTDIQTLCPTRIGMLGSNTINYYLQNNLNPKEESKREALLTEQIIIDTEKSIPVKKEIYLREGDKVIHNTNNYKLDWYEKKDGKYIIDPKKKGVFNGEIGEIEEIIENVENKKEYKTIAVKYKDGYVLYEKDFSELELAYALTIHKSQGSQWFEVIMPISESNVKYIYREMLYTAFTRAQDIAVVIGEPTCIEKGISGVNPERRNSTLSERINKVIKC